MPSSSLILSAPVNSCEYLSSSIPSFRILSMNASGTRNPHERPVPERPSLSTMIAACRLMCSRGDTESIPASTPTPKSPDDWARANLALFEAPERTCSIPIGWALATDEVSTSTNVHPGKNSGKTDLTPLVLAGFLEPIATSGCPGRPFPSSMFGGSSRRFIALRPAEEYGRLG